MPLLGINSINWALLLPQKNIVIRCLCGFWGHSLEQLHGSNWGEVIGHLGKRCARHFLSEQTVSRLTNLSSGIVSPASSSFVSAPTVPPAASPSRVAPASWNNLLDGGDLRLSDSAQFFLPSFTKGSWVVKLW